MIIGIFRGYQTSTITIWKNIFINNITVSAKRLRLMPVATRFGVSEVSHKIHSVVY
jgi:hypothetical protein